jgi:NADPH:quinone reductase-like Zn-dependent oxidoreductase
VLQIWGESMKASVLYQFGNPDVLKYEDYPDPVLGRGEVLVKVAAASINPVDLLERKGMLKDWKTLTFPAIIGWDMAGTVVQIGEDVSNFRVGDRVLAWTYCTYAELCPVSTRVLAKVPDKLDLIDAATLPLVGITGSQLISVAGEIQPNQTVLVAGAAGGVGRSAVYTAKDRGAYVIAGVLKKQIDAGSEIGADEIVALDDEQSVGALPQVDIVANAVRGKTAELLLEKVKPGGVFASVTGAPANAERFPTVRVKSFVSKQDPEVLAYCADGAVAGKLKIPVANKFDLREARAAHEAMEQGGVKGKVLLIP